MVWVGHRRVYESVSDKRRTSPPGLSLAGSFVVYAADRSWSQGVLNSMGVVKSMGTSGFSGMDATSWVMAGPSSMMRSRW